MSLLTLAMAPHKPTEFDLELDPDKVGVLLDDPEHDVRCAADGEPWPCAARVALANQPGAIPGLPVNWPSPSTNTPNVDTHPLEHYWSDRMTEPRPEDVERLAGWLEEDIQKNSGTEFAYRAWARELLLRLSIKP